MAFVHPLTEEEQRRFAELAREWASDGFGFGTYAMEPPPSEEFRRRVVELGRVFKLEVKFEVPAGLTRFSCTVVRVRK